ncbi:MAG: HAD family phosphatase [Candidatus Aenigmatarchaeota archaeon]|nr:HAD family phosphatase [Candidatus Aenigmarchaeota archaeon]
MFKAVIFDFDGTLVESEEMHCISLSNSIKQLKGLNITPKQIGLLAGMTYQEKLKRLIPGIKDEEAEKIAKHAYDNYLSTYSKKIKLRDKAAGYIKFLHQKGLKIGLYSPNKKQYLKDVLARFDLLKYFDVIIGREDIKKPKPDPEGYLLAAERLKVKPEQCLVFEDTPTGFASAKSAGMKVIVLYNPYLKNPEYPGALKIIKGYDEAIIL